VLSLRATRFLQLDFVEEASSDIVVARQTEAAETGSGVGSGSVASSGSAHSGKLCASAFSRTSDRNATLHAPFK